jgi:calcineurin-like phosphoesterase family protein
MATFLTADWHLGEDRLKLLGRPFASTEEMHETMIRLHNEMVSPDDEVFLIGDAIACADPQGGIECLSLIDRFHGRKTLFRGNQEFRFSDALLLEHFERVIPEGDGLELDYDGIPLYLTHYPSRGRADRFNLVGHIHSSWKVQLNMLNVGVDVHHFRPVPLERVRFFFDAIANFYDEDVWVGYHDLNVRYRGLRGKPKTYFETRDVDRADFPKPAEPSS